MVVVLMVFKWLMVIDSKKKGNFTVFFLILLSFEMFELFSVRALIELL